ncbi:MAG: tyramine oxidase subunit B [Oscillospiraceae bacterium]|jgi:ornithine cyclodeaminase/alanine dehydrogenase-like protein (mu-crystallin family)|nr:tyramine oxidase subunit B [Oscillospiraceae bacterium]MDD3261246.1 tyramine oxidase subunit B [Oscillospiraceae bacterium]
MDTSISFLYLDEPDMIKAGVKDMSKCILSMEDMLLLLKKGDYVMGGENHNSHGCMITFPNDPQFPGMPKNAFDRRFMAMPAYLGGKYQMAGVKWYGSNVENKEKGLPRSILMMTLSDKDTGAPLAFMSANLLSAYRTGGIPGVGAKYLARKDSRTAAVIGPGVMGKTSLAAFAAACPKLSRVQIKGRGQRSIDSFITFIKEELPQIKEIKVCDTVEEAVRGSDIISFTTTVKDDVSTFPYINGSWIKKGALISMPSAARFDDDYLSQCRLVVDNSKLYEAWEEEYPYPTYPKMQIIGTKFTDLIHDGLVKREDVTDITDIITGAAPGRKSEDEVIVYSVGGMPVEDIAWGCTVYRSALEKGIGRVLPLWEKPEMA